MTEYANSMNLSAPNSGEPSTTTIAEVAKIISMSSRMDIEAAPHIRCPNCKSQVIVGSSNSGDLVYRNGKRPFCDGADRIPHEEKCVAQIQKIIEYYNRRELTTFQGEVNIP
jgi:hypothetical protein